MVELKTKSNGAIYTLIPEPFTLNRETGAEGEESKNQGSGYGIQLYLTASSLPFKRSYLVRSNVFQGGLEPVHDIFP